MDRYEDVLSVEIYCLGIELRKQEIYRSLLETFRDIGEPISCIRERSEGKLRALEGMEDSVCYPAVDGFELSPKEEVIITENGLRFAVDVASGQKTGYFLDQKYNRAAVAKLAMGRNVLDCCTHNGGFALNCAAAGAASVLGIDISAPAIEQCRRNAQLNGLTNVSFEQHDMFAFLRDTLEAKQHPWDLIILDPPAFTKSRSTVRGASIGYDEINTLAGQAPIGCDGLTILPFGNGAERVLLNRNIGSSIHGIDLNRHGQAHLLRAAQEGVAFALMYGIEKLGDVHVIRAGKANMFLSPLFRQTLSNVSGATIELYDTDGSVGVARGAGLGAGIYHTPDEAFASLQCLLRVEPEHNGATREAYARWKSILDTSIQMSDSSKTNTITQ